MRTFIHIHNIHRKSNQSVQNNLNTVVRKQQSVTSFFKDIVGNRAITLTTGRLVVS